MNIKKPLDIEKQEVNGEVLYAGVKVKKLKGKKKKKENVNGRRSPSICNNCLSSLLIDEEGKYECSGDRLKIWEREFLNYVKLNEKEKIRYLMAFSHPDLFEELFDKWNHKDQEGHRPNFECGYSNKIYSLINPLRVMLPDPILCKKIEQSLGRALTDEEKYGEKDIFRAGNSYFDDFKKGRTRVKIALVFFPDGC